MERGRTSTAEFILRPPSPDSKRHHSPSLEKREYLLLLTQRNQALCDLWGFRIKWVK
jgi:hypothetical protein